ncbi:PIN domain-containing protein [Streptomyces sviceus]|uniref:PIN domain-containing protein n=1 Tax=Streptomyces sviceus TaxID=285530 RepID=UPI0036BC2480
MRLRPGASLELAEMVLSKAMGIWYEAGRASDAVTAYFDAVVALSYDYTHIFASPDLGAGLQNATYWNLLSLSRARAARPKDADGVAAWRWNLRGFRKSIVASPPTGWAAYRRERTAESEAACTEIRAQAEAVDRAWQELQVLKQLADRIGLPVVYDTNMFNHWSQPGDIPWRRVLKDQGESAKLCRLIVPLTVIDELDRQKYGQGELARKAGTAIRYLERVLKDSGPGDPVRLREDVTLEIWVDTDERGGDADLAILRCAADLDNLHAPKIQLIWDPPEEHPAQGARVLTDDFGMRLRAQQMGLTVLRLPEEYRKKGTALDDVPRT